MIPIKLPREQKEQMIERIQQYYYLERSEEIGNLAAEQLIDFLAKEVGPYIYNKAIEDASSALLQKVESLEEELYSLKKPIR